MTLQQATQQIRERKLAIENDGNLEELRKCLNHFWPNDNVLTKSDFNYYFESAIDKNSWTYFYRNPLPASIKASELAAMIDAEKEGKEPKAGEWWTNDAGGVGRIESFVTDDNMCVKVNYSEYYDRHRAYLSPNGGYDWIKTLKHPATKEEIEHFMGLHTERLGMKEGVKVDRSNLSSIIASSIVTLNWAKANYNFRDGHFSVGGFTVRDENGQWATVVKEEEQWQPKVGEMVEASDDGKEWLEWIYFGKGNVKQPYLVENPMTDSGDIISVKFCRPIQKEEITLTELAKLAGKDINKLKIID